MGIQKVCDEGCIFQRHINTEATLLVMPEIEQIRRAHPIYGGIQDKLEHLLIDTTPKWYYAKKNERAPLSLSTKAKQIAVSVK